VRRETTTETVKNPSCTELGTIYGTNSARTVSELRGELACGFATRTWNKKYHKNWQEDDAEPEVPDCIATKGLVKRKIRG
jgi:hypothetical protein